jgi:hypothetical protein
MEERFLKPASEELDNTGCSRKVGTVLNFNSFIYEGAISYIDHSFSLSIHMLVKEIAIK